MPKDNELVLSKLYITSENRGKGYGKQCVRFIENMARKSGLNKISLMVNKNNKNSIKAYEKFGFAIVCPVVTDIGGGFVMDDYRMEKPLTVPAKGVLVFSPFCFHLPSYVPLGIAQIKSFVELHSKHSVKCFDFNLEFFLKTINNCETACYNLFLANKKFREYYPDHKLFLKCVEIIPELLRAIQDERIGHEQLCSLRDRVQKLYSPIINCVMDFLAQAEENHNYRKIRSILAPYRDLILKESADIFGFSLFETRQLLFSVALAKLLRQVNHKKIVFGGGVISRMSDNEKGVFLKEHPYVDYLIEKEGEESFLGLLNGQNPDSIPNLTYRYKKLVRQSSVHKGIDDLANLSAPDYADFKIKDYVLPRKTLLLSTAKNCPWNRCIFCRAKVDFNQGFRQKKVGQVIRELKLLMNRHKVDTLFFADPSVEASYAKELSTEIIKAKLNVHYGLMMRFEKELDSEALIKQLYKSGCRYILFGVETLTARLSKLICKGIDVRNIKKILLNCKKQGIYCHLTVIFGLPSQTESEMRREIKELKIICDRTNFTCEINKLGIDPGAIIYENIHRDVGISRFSAKRDKKLKVIIAYANNFLNENRLLRLARLDDIFLTSLNSSYF